MFNLKREKNFTHRGKGQNINMKRREDNSNGPPYLKSHKPKYNLFN